MVSALHRPLRVLLLAHGYPPRETAGTERHTELLAKGLHGLGHAVAVVAATRAPGRRQYASWTEDGPVPVTRIVNNVPALPAAQAEVDPAMEELIGRRVAEFAPDLVHVQHLQFLSSGLRFEVPWVVSLHDAWAWCAAGGTLLELPERQPCPGPEPHRCARCYAAWRPVPTRAARGLMGVAGALASVVSPDQLHGAWQRLPARIRRPVAASHGAPPDPEGMRRRTAAVGAFFSGAPRRLAPSRFLAEAAEAQGLGPVHLLGNGVPEGRPRAAGAGSPWLFLGTVAWHKGPDLVVQAWRSLPEPRAGLRLVGPVLEPDSTLGHPTEGPADRAQVEAALAGARALVLGSRWPENAPLVVLEARAAGCPVVAPRTGGLPELVDHGVDGLLYETGDAASLARAMEALERVPRWSPRPPPTVDEMCHQAVAHYRALLGEAP